jgi:CheY-like chemotaxis protein
MKFDLVLLDVMMPVMDGLQVLATVRERERERQTMGRATARQWIVMATAHDSPGDRERLLLSGADGYVAKPIDAPRLQAEFDRVLGR